MSEILNLEDYTKIDVKDLNILRHLKNLHNIYLLETNSNISFKNFITPKVMLDNHQKIGTIFKSYDKRFKHINHFIYFGAMFFYRKLTNLEIYEIEN